MQGLRKISRVFPPIPNFPVTDVLGSGGTNGYDDAEAGGYQDPSRVVQNIADRAWFMGKDIAQGLGSAVQDEEIRRDIFQKAWNAGATAAKFATEAATDEDARSRVRKQLRQPLVTE